jgi:hypothetical protein
MWLEFPARWRRQQAPAATLPVFTCVLGRENAEREERRKRKLLSKLKKLM